MKFFLILAFSTLALTQNVPTMELTTITPANTTNFELEAVKTCYCRDGGKTCFVTCGCSGCKSGSMCTRLYGDLGTIKTKTTNAKIKENCDLVWKTCDSLKQPDWSATPTSYNEVKCSGTFNSGTYTCSDCKTCNTGAICKQADAAMADIKKITAGSKNSIEYTTADKIENYCNGAISRTILWTTPMLVIVSVLMSRRV
jgi:hypothetical protein